MDSTTVLVLCLIGVGLLLLGGHLRRRSLERAQLRRAALEAEAERQATRARSG